MYPHSDGAESWTEELQGLLYMWTQELACYDLYLIKTSEVQKVSFSHKVWVQKDIETFWDLKELGHLVNVIDSPF